MNEICTNFKLTSTTLHIILLIINILSQLILYIVLNYIKKFTLLKYNLLNNKTY